MERDRYEELALSSLEAKNKEIDEACGKVTTIGVRVRVRSRARARARARARK